MDKNAIKKYAVWARNELIARVSQRAQRYGITIDQIVDANADSVNGIILTDTEKKQRQALIQKIREKGFEQVMEEVAYTWFNRFSALRFMEVNGYLPSHVRVFTDQNNAFKPEIMTEAIHLDLDGLDMEKVYALKEANNDDELFKYLIITQCNDLSKILPGMFQKIADYTEMLFPDNLLREGSAIEQMIALIPEEDWKNQVQIIGWLYQYYNSEPKDQVFADLKKNKKITKEKIPAATQLFTPDWIVRYMVENSLGRLWVEGHPNDELKSQWKYYLDEAEQEPDVQKQLTEIRKEYSALKPEEIKCIDPCCGSGHILAYMFDVLIQIYGAYGISARDAAASIVKNNIYGLDIDERAAQLAQFSVMMKARQYDRRFFSRDVQPNVYAIEDSNGITSAQLHDLGIGLSSDDYGKAVKQIMKLIDEFHDAKEYGSIISVSEADWDLLRKFAVPRWEAEGGQISFDVHGEMHVAPRLQKLISLGEILSQKYGTVVTNPPYMGSSGMSAKLTNYVKKFHPESKSDLFAVFIEVCARMTSEIGFQAMITQQGWMFLANFENLRKKILQHEIINMAHLGPRAFEEIGGEVVQTTSFVLSKRQIKGYKGTFCRLLSAKTQHSKEQLFLSGKERYCGASTDSFFAVPGEPIAYWTGERFSNLFSRYKNLSECAEFAVGISTGNNDKYLKLWYEVDNTKIAKNIFSDVEFQSSSFEYAFCNKGGPCRRWYGNSEYVALWRKADEFHRNAATYRNLLFKAGVSWSEITMDSFAARFFPNGMIFDHKAPSVFGESDEKMYYYLALLNSKPTEYIFNIINPTISTGVDTVRKLPVIEVKDYNEVIQLARENVSIAKVEWDSYETSWDFKEHPFIWAFRELTHKSIGDASCFYDDKGNKVEITIEFCYRFWQKKCNERLKKIKNNEEKINELFIAAYGLENVLAPEVQEIDITLRTADVNRDIRSFISYAMGCIFGRYSIDQLGISFAGGKWDVSNYKTILVDRDGIIPICDDEYFDDDIVGLFIRFIEKVYGKDTLEKNLQFIADSIGGKGSPREIIRNYFLNDFYSDHCKIYQKRPIYWLFDSGKKNGFKCLIYMHRYQSDTIARIRTDYVHEQQSRYRTAIADLEQRIESASTSDRVKLSKKLKHLQEQSTEIHDYEEKIHHLADQYISIDLDDGVKANYAKFQEVLAKIK